MLDIIEASLFHLFIIFNNCDLRNAHSLQTLGTPLQSWGSSRSWDKLLQTWGSSRSLEHRSKPGVPPDPGNNAPVTVSAPPPSCPTSKRGQNHCLDFTTRAANSRRRRENSQNKMFNPNNIISLKFM